MSKRVFDVVAAGLMLVLLSPLFLIIVVLIKSDSDGPVIFQQQRIGRNFNPFTLYKFRTMGKDAGRQGRLITVAGDPRITRVGQVLRRFKLDELPQLWNVVKGDMSIVGPRPEVAKYVDKFRDDYAAILGVRPGLTDLSSIKYIDEQGILARVDDPEAEYINRILPEKIAIAKEYTQGRSFYLDLSLIFRTVFKLFK